MSDVAISVVCSTESSSSVAAANFPGSPAGFDDIGPSWSGPDALVRRVEAADRIASRAGGQIDARQLGPRILPAALSDATAQSIARAESPGQGLALLLVSPEFLRR